jgi:hypothetical protein
VIVPLTLADGTSGLDDRIRDVRRESRAQAGVPPPTPGSTTPTAPTVPTGPTATVPTPPPSVPTPPPPASEPPHRAPVERRVGETGTDDGLEITVRSIREVKTIERDSYYRSDFKAPRGGTLVSAEVTFVNRSKEPADPFCGGNSAALYDGQGRLHETLKALYSIEGNDSICGGADTLPGDTATVTLAFRLKRGERIDHLDLWNGKFVPDFDGEATRVRFRQR